ncbi:MAG: hypothetical protein ACOC1U_07925, partial [Spirochaetota bacterium]
TDMSYTPPHAPGDVARELVRHRSRAVRVIAPVELDGECRRVHEESDCTLIQLTMTVQRYPRGRRNAGRPERDGDEQHHRRERHRT